MEQIDARVHYRNTANRVKVGPLDAWAIAPLPVVWFAKSWTVFFIALLVFAFFFALDKKGLTLPNFLRRARCFISTNHKLVSTRKSRYFG